MQTISVVSWGAVKRVWLQIWALPGRMENSRLLNLDTEQVLSCFLDFLSLTGEKRKLHLLMGKVLLQEAKSITILDSLQAVGVYHIQLICIEKAHVFHTNCIQCSDIQGISQANISFNHCRSLETHLIFSKVNLNQNLCFHPQNKCNNCKNKTESFQIICLDLKDGPIISEPTKLVLNHTSQTRKQTWARKQTQIPTWSSGGWSFSKAASVSAEVIFHLEMSSGVMKEMRGPSLGNSLSGYPSGYVCGKTTVIAMNTHYHACAYEFMLFAKLMWKSPKGLQGARNQS